MANRKHSKGKHRSTPRPQIAAMAFIGSGLVLIGVVALLLLPKPQVGARPGSSGSVSVIPVEVNYPAPDLQLTDLQGNPVAISDYLGQVVLVNNWATWCPPCKAEMPVLEAYHQDHQAQGFSVIAIEAGEPVSMVSDFARQYKLSFPVWPDPETRALAAFRNDSLPSSYVIDRSGTVRLAWTGAITREALENTITPLLEQ